mmetsp:Transcript_88842/g.251778  ORF Transcript_88842/g.251778 Transcript_88842/m.251778 type:complete len:156 (-) Transcript_88842:247-714(-)
MCGSELPRRPRAPRRAPEPRPASIRRAGTDPTSCASSSQTRHRTQSCSVVARSRSLGKKKAAGGAASGPPPFGGALGQCSLALRAASAQLKQYQQERLNKDLQTLPALWQHINGGLSDDGSSSQGSECGTRRLRQPDGADAAELDHSRSRNIISL